MTGTHELETERGAAQVSTRTASRRWWTGALTLAMSLGFATLSAGPASAYVGPDLLRNWETGLCLDSGPGDEGGRGQVYTNPCQPGNDYQTWNILYQGHDGHDIVMIQDKATGLCLSRQLDVSTLPCNGAAADQRWLAVGGGWNNVQLKSSGSGACLDSNRNRDVYTLGCNGGGYQAWKLGL